MIKKMIIYLFLFSGLYANFEVAPQIQELSLDRQATQKIYLKNGTKKLKKIKIYSRRPEDQKTKDLYMGDWVIVYPKIVYLKPNSKKVIRMAARPPKGLVEGEYRSHLVFEEVPVKKYDNTEKDEEKVGVDLEVVHILVSTVYGYRGKLEYGGNFDTFQLVTDKKKTYLVSKITNIGTTALDVVYKITYYKDMKKLKTEDLLVGKAMRENYLDSVVELNKISKDANKMKVEFYYRVKIKNREGKEGEKEYDEFKLGEKLITVKKISAEKYLKELEEKTNKKEKEGTVEMKNKAEKKG
ncbi:hypothetical protein [Psychrilyobacter atlanticus]|uniref:hypothetical protein n=1 Tax=Psychrilyobacter atlanticus TaxID=271091 RepID=UPI0003F6A311|nr:hypothetical protein [Psychrilyobacter atlanticus]